jgi:hypothetical protein
LKYTDEFLESITEKPIEKILEICKEPNEYFYNHAYASGEYYNLNEDDYEWILNAYSLVLSIFDEKILEPITDPLVLSGSLANDAWSLHKYFENVYNHYIVQGTNLKVQNISSIFKNKFKNGFAYEFTQGDIKRIQDLINELRAEIGKSAKIPDEHKTRLLKRLEKLQSEMHKKMSDLDRFWGLVGDAGVVIGKFGNDAKPIVDRIREIAAIVWRTQSNAEELPSGTQNPMLPHTPDSE